MRALIQDTPESIDSTSPKTLNHFLSPIRSKIATAVIMGILATEPVVAASQHNKHVVARAEYISRGDIRIVVANGRNADEIHTLAYQEFVNNISLELKSAARAKQHLRVENFSTKYTRLPSGEFELRYAAELKRTNEAYAHTVFDMRGTVHTKDFVTKENSKKLAKFHHDMECRYDQVIYKQDDSGNTRYYHQAEVAMARKPLEKKKC